jgi:hypothetical protein
VSEWEVAAVDFPKDYGLPEQLLFCLRYAILAPSAQNAQPWLFRVEGQSVEVYADRSRALPIVDPSNRQLVMGCGAALLNLLVAIRRFGYSDVTEVLPEGPDSDLLARVRIEPAESPSEETHALFDAITERRTNRRAFSERPIGYQIADELSAAAEQQGAHFVRLSPEQKLAAAGLIAEGDRRQFHDRHFRRELADWTSVDDDRRDGVPGVSKGFGDIMKVAAPLIIRTFDRGDKIAAKEHELATHSPILAALCTDTDDREAWLRSGLALGRVLLVARIHGIDASYLNQPLERPELRPEFAKLIGNGFPQLILRMGFGPPVPPSRRRPVEDVLLPPR